MSILDILILLPVIWGIYKGFTKGLIIEVASLLALLIGIYGAMKFYGVTSGLIEEQISTSQKYLPIIAFGLTFVGIVIGIHLLAKIIDKLVKAVALGIVNRIAGAVFGGLKFFLIIGAIMVVVDKLDSETHFLEEKTKQESILYQPSLNLVYGIFPTLNKLKNTDFTPDIDVNMSL